MGEDRCGGFGDEGERRSGAVPPRLSPDLVEALTAPVVAAGASQPASGKEPGGGLWGAGPGGARGARGPGWPVARVGRSVKCRRVGDGATVEVDVIDSGLADGGDLLGAEDGQQQSCNTEVGRASSLRRRASAHRFSLSMMLSGSAQTTVPWVRSREYLCRADQPAKWPFPSGYLLLELAILRFRSVWVQASQREPFVDEPVEKVARDGDVAARVQILELGSVVSTEVGAEPRRCCQPQVAVQDVLMLAKNSLRLWAPRAASALPRTAGRLPEFPGNRARHSQGCAESSWA